MEKETGTPCSVALPTHILSLMERLENAGEEVYLVGGSLRDALLGQPPHDFDLATSARPEQMLSLFSDLTVIPTGLKHGTVTVLCDGEPVEITTFRVDGTYTDARHPDRVRFTDRIAEDLSRRDFTVNAMAYHPKTGLIDPFDGQKDIQRGILRTVGIPQQRFSEDALRIMRAFRFSAQLGFSVSLETVKGLTECRDGLAYIAQERIASEFLRLLLSQDPTVALRLMIQSGVLPYVTPGYCPGEAILQAFSADPPQEDVARLGLFFADADQEQASALLHRLRYSNQQIKGVRAILRGISFSVQSAADARRLIAVCGVYARVAVQISVILGISPMDANGWVENNTAACTLSELAVTGKDLLAVGLDGKTIGNTLQYLLGMVLEDPALNQKETLLALAKQEKTDGNTKSGEKQNRK